jgi:hypothetical protein
MNSPATARADDDEVRAEFLCLRGKRAPGVSDEDAHGGAHLRWKTTAELRNRRRETRLRPLDQTLDR